MYLIWLISHLGSAALLMRTSTKYFNLFSIFWGVIYFIILLQAELETDLLVYKSLFSSPYDTFHFAPMWIWVSRLMAFLSVPIDYRMITMQVVVLFMLLLAVKKVDKSAWSITLLSPILYLCLFNSMAQGIASFLIVLSIYFYNEKKVLQSFLALLIASTLHLSSPVFLSVYFATKLLENFVSSFPRLLRGKLSLRLIFTLWTVCTLIIILIFLKEYISRFTGYFVTDTDHQHRISPYIRSLFYLLALCPGILLYGSSKKTHPLFSFSLGLVLLTFLLNLIGAFELASRVTLQVSTNLIFIGSYFLVIGKNSSAAFIVVMFGLSTQIVLLL